MQIQFKFRIIKPNDIATRLEHWNKLLSQQGIEIRSSICRSFVLRVSVRTSLKTKQNI